ncbi:MAG: FAD-dependent thymidylate synthase [Nitrospirae bacterium]|nr:MAG: FAD-dependent thymidylate synthase [Nitrospirota bacterium]
MPPEKSAYALARYSRSPDSIEDSLRWVHGHSSEKFWEQFYFDYGHASIADLGHVIICFEGISELAAVHLEDEVLWDGQAKSSRYQNFGPGGVFVPEAIVGTPVETTYRGIATKLHATYESLHAPIKASLTQQTPKPDDMKPATYDRTMDARTFDITRYLLTLASQTNIGQVVSIRTLEKQIGRLLSLPIAELQAIGEDLKTACATPPVNVWGELSGHTAGLNEPLAPTLARYARPSEYVIKTYPELTQAATERLRLGEVQSSDYVELLERHEPLDELTTTLLYRVTAYPYRQILARVREWAEKEKEELIDVALRRRGPYDELLKEFHCGYGFVFDILMDVGGWRDLHRHRRCQQIRQEFTTAHGYDTPDVLKKAGVEPQYRATMELVRERVESLALSHPEAAAYLTPFGFRTRCLFKMDYAEAEYIARLRSGVKGHFSYRKVAWLMQQALCARYPFLGDRIKAVPPDIEDSLTR